MVRRPTKPSLAGLALAVLEGCAVTAVIGVLAYSYCRTEVSFSEHVAGWFMLAPTFVALRHGLWKSLAFTLLLCVGLLAAWHRAARAVHLPIESLVGIAVPAAMVGYFSDVWRNRLEGASRETERANALARSHALLEISHDRLSDQIERSQSSLRDATTALFKSIESGDTSFCTHGAAMLEVFATYCGLEMGELFEVAAGRLRERCAAFGMPPETKATDPLLERALATGRLTYVPIAGSMKPSRRMPSTTLLAAVPFVDALGTIRAILCVHAMPFMAFHRRNLEAMSTLGGHFTDLLRGGSVDTMVRPGHGSCDVATTTPITLRTPR
ncbi:MAG: hypothetical protein FWD73_07910 [Polyangiaceae bacterium]|nr:hypothetical protein [Polyangiaceae bacterium]